ncbi:MAG: hypothetical protein LDL19_08265 [Thiobacillus sp.]|nr:hypothetical protein [Thiobacillus sp.]
MSFSLTCSLAAWNAPEFNAVFKREVEALDARLLPLQQGLSRSSSVADEPFCVMPLAAGETAAGLWVKAGVAYAGIVGGCSCADDPTPVESQPEYCVLMFEIDADTGAARVALAPEA